MWQAATAHPDPQPPTQFTMQYWVPGELLRWFIDGHFVYEVNKQALRAQSNSTFETLERLIPVEPMHIIFNLAVARAWVLLSRVASEAERVAGWLAEGSWGTAMAPGGDCGVRQPGGLTGEGCSCRQLGSGSVTHPPGPSHHPTFNPHPNPCLTQPAGSFGSVDLADLPFPSEYKIDYVRVYQPPAALNVDCSPPDYPTKQYIACNRDVFLLSEEEQELVEGPCERAASCRQLAHVEFQAIGVGWRRGVVLWVGGWVG